ncbi:disease resistance protein-like protein [Tanacetum coccineum]
MVEEDLAKWLGLRFKTTTQEGRAHELWKRLLQNKKRTLVILDDVWKHIHLKSIGIPFENEYNNCKAILTSRSKDACEAMECHDILTLDKMTKSKPELPIREIKEKKYGMTRSKNCRALWYQQILKAREDVLSSVQLIIMIFYRDLDQENARDRVHALTEKLKSRYLLLSSDRKSTVKVHIVVRVVGISIASMLEQNLEQFSAAVIHEDIWPRDRKVLFTNLRLLDMSGCHWLERISPGVISSLSQLEELDTGSKLWGDEEEGDASLTEMLLLKLDITDTHIGGGIDKLLRKNTEKVFLTRDGMKATLKELVPGRFQLDDV